MENYWYIAGWPVDVTSYAPCWHQHKSRETALYCVKRNHFTAIRKVSTFENSLDKFQSPGWEVIDVEKHQKLINRQIDGTRLH